MTLQLLLNGRFFNRPVTGVERVALELGRAVRNVLAELGERDIEVVVPPGISMTQRIGELGAPAPRVMTAGRLRGQAWEQVELPRVEPDAWLLNLCNTGPVARRRQALVICDAQFMLHPESYSRAFRWWYRVMIPLVSRRAEAVFTISEFSKSQLERFGLVPRGKAHVLRLGVDHLTPTPSDTSIFARHDLTARPYLLAIGSLARHKNLGTLIDAFVEADLRGVDLVVVGGGNPRIFKAAGLREAPNIRYLGRVTDSELKALYGQALAFACPSLSEGFGFAPLEAMSMGCPVIATTGGAVPEVCGDAAMYVEPLDGDGWRDALQMIVGDDNRREDFARRAKARAGLFTWRDAACQMLSVLAERDGDEALLSALARSSTLLSQSQSEGKSHSG